MRPIMRADPSMRKKLIARTKLSAIAYTEKDLPQGSPEWHEWRRGGIGAHEILTIAMYARELGLEPIPAACATMLPERPAWLNTTPLQLFNHKVHGIAGNSERAGVDHWGQKRAAVLKCLEFYELKPHSVEAGPLRVSLAGLNTLWHTMLDIKVPMKVWTEGPPWNAVAQAHYERAIVQKLGPGYQACIAAAYDRDVHEGQHRNEQVAVDLFKLKYNRPFGTWLCRIANQFWKRYVLTGTPPPEVALDVRVRHDSAWQNAAATYRHALKAVHSAVHLLSLAREDLIALTGEDAARHTGDGLSVVTLYAKPGSGQGRSTGVKHVRAS